MARRRLALCFTLLALLMSFQLSTSTDPPTEPPANPPEADAPESPSPPADSSTSPGPSPSFPPDSSSSPGPSPSFPPSDGDDEYPSPSPSPDDGPEADAPAPEAGEWTNVKSGVRPEKKESEGMSGGKKAGIVIGVFAFAGLAALGGFVYKKRKENMERAAFGAAVRREFL